MPPRARRRAISVGCLVAGMLTEPPADSRLRRFDRPPATHPGTPFCLGEPDHRPDVKKFMESEKNLEHYLIDIKGDS